MRAEKVVNNYVNGTIVKTVETLIYQHLYGFYNAILMQLDIKIKIIKKVLQFEESLKQSRNLKKKL